MKKQVAMNIPDNTLAELYGADNLKTQRKRYQELVREYSECFGEPKSLQCISAPGRTELGGNHTDHNHGKVLCAAVSQDSVAVVETRSDNLVKLKLSAFPKLYDMDLSELDPKKAEKGTT